MNSRAFVGALAAALFAASAANADLLFHSGGQDFSANPAEEYCSQCQSNGQIVGEYFTLLSAGDLNQLTFVAFGDSNYWPGPIDVDIFSDAGSNTLGTNVYHQSFSTYLNDAPTGVGTDIVSVNLGSLVLYKGSYELFISSGSNFVLAGFSNPNGAQIRVNSAPGMGPTEGQSYVGGLHTDAGIELYGTPVPEPGTWAFLIGGIGYAGFALRRRRVIPRQRCFGVLDRPS